MLNTIVRCRLMYVPVLSLFLLTACQTAAPTPAAALPTMAPTAAAEGDAPPAAAAPLTATDVPPTEAPTATPVPAYSIDYDRVLCKFDVPTGYEVECGYLTVPEQRAHAENRRTIRLHVAVFKSFSEEPAADPVVYLDGGPGSDALERAPLFISSFSPFLFERDFIMFDQRGTGYSQPSLACPEITELTFELVELNPDESEAVARTQQAYFDCFDRLASAGVNFAAFNSAENAADVADLRRALGYGQWNLYGISYGTRLALTVIRDDPEGVRSVILDSTYPPEANLFLEAPANLDRAFGVFFAGCAADPACNSAYPNLEAVFYNLVDRLNTNPGTINIFNSREDRNYLVPFTGNDLMSALFQSLYSSSVIPLLPQFIYEVNNGNYGVVSSLLGSYLSSVDYMSVGMQYAVQCYDEASFTEPGEPAAAQAEYPQYRPFFENSLFFNDSIFTACARLGTERAPALENEPVSSDLPILVMAGEYDPITPPVWGEAAAAHLPNSYYFFYPGLGHGVSIAGACPLQMALQFLNNPAARPDDRCQAQMGGPAFVVPDDTAGTVVEMVPFESEVYGAVMTGVFPLGWWQIQPGTFVRQQTALDQALLMQQVAPGVSAENFLNLVISQWGLTSPPTASGTYQGGGHQWLLYEAQFEGNHMDIALAEEGVVTFFVVLISPDGEEVVLFQSILLPVLNALAIE